MRWRWMTMTVPSPITGDGPQKCRFMFMVVDGKWIDVRPWYVQAWAKIQERFL